MPETLIIGVGSYYEQDRAGIEIVEQFQSEFPFSSRVAFYTTNAPQEILVLAETLKNHTVKKIIILDALEKPVCDITQLTLQELQPTTIQFSAHYTNLHDILQIIRLLYFPDVQIIILGVSNNVAQIIHKLKHICLN